MDEPVRPGLIGRVVEKATLSRLLERASTGHGGSLLLAGEPGIGKSELAEWTAATASARGFTQASNATTEKSRSPWGKRLLIAPCGVELRGFEPLTSSMPWRRATNCAKAPNDR